MKTNQIINTDCIEWLRKQESPFADLIFADPPFNIGYQYDVYEDVHAYEDYYHWTEQWMGACYDSLKPAGTFWVAIGDEYAAEVRMIGRKLGLTLRNWVIWHYTFGQNTKAKFARSHVHLFYFVKHPTEFTFRDLAVRTFSDRQRIYRDKRANPLGKIPDDTWSEFPRLCGTFDEREGWHPCQMPLSVLTQIISSTSNLDDVVFDPFSGSGTTLVAAKKLSRQYLGTELSENYVKNMKLRLDKTIPIAQSQGCWPDEHAAVLQGLYTAAAVPIGTLGSNDNLLKCFTQHFNNRLTEYGDSRSYKPNEIFDALESLRTSAKLPVIKIHEQASTQAGKPSTLFDNP